MLKLFLLESWELGDGSQLLNVLQIFKFTSEYLPVLATYTSKVNAFKT
jgi:hypothetical protein